ncbi:hypothetical protein V568_200011 [Brucella ceti TE28753-12]|nr:hypothetical protein V568_200011 [Brucella ceti TE28753-12]
MKKYFSKVWTGACSGVMRARASISAGLAIAAVAMVVLPSQASAETRSLKLYYVHTGEKAEIAFKKDGRFLPDGLKRLNVFLRDWRRNEPTRMDPRLFDLIWQVYQSTGSREYITVVSAYRSPAWNSRVKPWLQPFLPAMLRCRCRRRVRKPGLMRRPQRRKRRLPPSMFLCLPTSRKWPRRMPWRSPPPKIRLLLHALPWMPIRHRLPMQACLPH